MKSTVSSSEAEGPAEARLAARLTDQRSRKVVFLSHCLLNENTRYLGGACRRGCVREVVQQCLDQGIGIVQMPCPEQQAWGGVLKKRLLRLYGTRASHPALHRLEWALLPIGLLFTRLVYRRLARQVAAQIDDYLRSGFEVLGVVGVDGSPSCGVNKTVEIHGAVEAISALDPRTVSVDQQNAVVRRYAQPGPGIFIAALQRALRRRGLEVPLLAHDLFDELDGRPSGLTFDAASTPAGAR